MDSSFSASVEIAYELAARPAPVEYLAGVQGEVPAAGLPHARALASWVADAIRDRTAGHHDAGAAPGFALKLQEASRSPVSIVDLGRTVEIAEALYDLASGLSSLVTSAAERDAIREMLFYEPVDFYTTPGDLALDIADLSAVVADAFPVFTPPSLALSAAVESALVPPAVGERGLSVNYIPLLADGRAAPTHHEDYLPGAPGAVAFARDGGWAPDPGDQTGLLYRLFYEEMP